MEGWGLIVEPTYYLVLDSCVDANLSGLWGK